MEWSKYLVILFLTTTIFNSNGKKLSTEENEKRLEVCGKKYMRSKVYNGRETKSTEAPWAVRVFAPSGACTGTLISSRHVTTTTHCFANFTGKVWTDTKLGYVFDRSKCGKHNNTVITEVLASKVAVYSNEKLIGRARNLLMFGFCRNAEQGYMYEYADDFTLIELSEDVEYSSYLSPACLARDTEDNKAGTVLDFYGYGTNPKPDTNEDSGPTGTLRHEKVKILNEDLKGTSKRIDPRVFHARSVSGTTVACPGDSGGGATWKIDGRDTVVGTHMQSTCKSVENRGKDSMEVYAAIGFHAKSICKYTGICTPDRSSSNGNSIAIALIFCALSAVFL